MFSVNSHQGWGSDAQCGQRKVRQHSKLVYERDHLRLVHKQHINGLLRGIQSLGEQFQTLLNVNVTKLLSDCGFKVVTIRCV